MLTLLNTGSWFLKELNLQNFSVALTLTQLIPLMLNHVFIIVLIKIYI